MSTLHPRLIAALEAANYEVFHKWQHEPDRYCVAYGLTNEPEWPLALEVTLFNINGTSCCFRLAVELGQVLDIFPWTEPRKVVPFHKQAEQTHASANSWVDDEEDLL